ncbi:MAG: glycosyltransferase [Lachnospiraceae bacterium]|nr:glycosyltransferase [Lachnospiraceae bacterium]
MKEANMETKMNIHRSLSSIVEVVYDGKFTPGKKILIAATHDMTTGGAPWALISMLDSIKDEYDCFVISPNDGVMTKEFVKRGYGVYIASPKAFEIPEFKHVLENADLYFCNTIVSGFFVSLAYNLKTPTIWWVHENRAYFERYKDYLSVNNCTSENIRIVAVTKRSAKDVEEFFHVKCEVLHFGIDDEYDKNDIEKKNSGGMKEVTTFFMPANFLYIKGHDVMEKAIRMLPKDYQDKTKFLFAGNKVEEGVYQLIERLSEEKENVSLLGRLERDEVYRLDGEVDAVVAPSRIDTLPATIIEGMMKGALCICSNAAGVSEYIDSGKNGFVFGSEDAKALSELFKYVVDHKAEMPQIKELGRQCYLEHFLKRSSVNRLKEIIEEIENQVNNPKTKRLVLFAGQIDILDIFVYQLRDAFVSMSYEVMIFDINNILESSVELLQFVFKPVTAMITFNNIGIDYKIDPKINFWEQWNIPCINILMDHPFCYHEEMLAMPQTGVVLCVDRNHMNYLLRFYPNLAACGYLPHGGIEIGGDKKPISQRNIDVLYVGGLSRNSAYKIMPDFTKYTDFDARKLCEDAYKVLVENPGRTLEEVVESLLVEQGINYQDDVLREIISDLHVIDLYVVSHFREKTVQVLAEAGINIELYGTGWELCEWINLPNVHYGGRISADEAVEKMKDTKIVLSTMTWFKDGTHDRVFNGMLQGAVAVSDSSAYMKETFDDSEMVQFELDELDTLADKVRSILDNPDKAQAMANQGYKKAVAEHTWIARARELEEGLF